MKLTKTTIEIEGVPPFAVYTNIPEREVFPAVINWAERTKFLCAKSFCNYVNEKRARGLSDHRALTEQEFLNQKKRQHESNFRSTTGARHFSR